MSYTVANLIMDMFDSAGVRHFFGLPGTSTLDMLDALYDKPHMRYVSVRHEQVAGSMAEGYSRATGEVTVCMLHSGSGSTSIMPAIASAWRDKAPVIVISFDERPWTIQESGWQSFDTMPLFDAATKWNVRIHKAEEAPRIIDRALTEATSGCPGPVHISLPKDLPSEVIPKGSPIRDDAALRCHLGAAYVPRHRPVPSAEAVRESAAFLSASSRPLIVAGGGVLWSDASEEVQKVAERIGGPVITTDLGRGSLPEDHPQNLGLAGFLGYPATLKALRQADCVLALGSELIDVHTGDVMALASGAKLIRVDISPEPAVTRFPVSLDIQADARTYLQALLDELPARNKPAAKVAAFTRAMKKQMQTEQRAYFSQRKKTKSNKLDGPFLVRELTATLPNNSLISVDAGLHTYNFAKVPINTHASFFNSSGLGSMATAFPNLFGAKLAYPDRPAVALLGDSCFMMAVQDFETVVREGINVVLVVYNNFRFGSQARNQQLRFGNRPIGTRHTNPDLAELAKLFGGAGERVEKRAEFQPALKRMLAAKKPAVIDCIMGPE